VKEKMAAHGKVRLLLHFGPAFAACSASAIRRDARFGLAQPGDFGKLAVVSDVAWPGHAVRLFAPCMRCPVRGFTDAEIDAAKAWLAT
jgi:hypothetical protein